MAFYRNIQNRSLDFQVLSTTSRKRHSLTSSRSHLLNTEFVLFAHHYLFPHTVALFLYSSFPSEIGGKLHLFSEIKPSWWAPLMCWKVSGRSFYKMTHLYLKNFLETLRSLLLAFLWRERGEGAVSWIHTWAMWQTGWRWELTVLALNPSPAGARWKLQQKCLLTVFWRKYWHIYIQTSDFWEYKCSWSALI